MDSESPRSLHDIPDDELLLRLGELVSHSRCAEAELVAHIGEVDARRLFARQAFASMFAYCTESLHLSEAEAYRRITVARAARKHPAILEALRGGRIPLSGLARLARLLTADNSEALLERATHRTTRQIEALVAELSPRPDVPPTIRRLPQRHDTPSVVAPEALTMPAELATGRVTTATASPDELVARRVAALPPLPARATSSSVQPLAPARFKVQFTASAELRDKLEQLTALMRSEIPDGRLD